MTDNGKHEANSGGEIAPLARRTGPAKGTPRPAGAGRKKGVPNRITKDVREAAAKHGKKALAKLVRLMEDQDARVALAATREILDRAYGRPVSPQEITGKDGTPLMEAMDDRKLAQSIAFAFAKDLKDRGIAMPPMSHHKPAETQSAPPAPPAPPEPEIDSDAASRWQDSQRIQQEYSRPEQRATGQSAPSVVRFKPRGS